MNRVTDRVTFNVNELLPSLINSVGVDWGLPFFQLQ